MRSVLLLCAAFCLACATPAPRGVVVVGFSADPGDPVPGRVMTSVDGESFAEPVALGEDREWLTEITRRGDGYAAIGLQGGVYLGDAHGEKWQRTRVHNSWLDAIRFLPDAPATGFLSGAGAWWHSSDAGGTWIRETPPGFYFEDFSFEDSTTGVGVEGYLEPPGGVVWRTTNAGVAWTPAASFPRGLRTLGRPDPHGPEIWAAGDGGLLVWSTNAGASWARVPVHTLLLAKPDFTDLDFPDAHSGFLAGSRGTLGTWHEENPYESRWSFVDAGDFVLQGIFARSATDAWACGYRTGTDHGVILRTRDGGTSWQIATETRGVFWYGIAGRREHE